MFGAMSYIFRGLANGTQTRNHNPTPGRYSARCVSLVQPTPGPAARCGHKRVLSAGPAGAELHGRCFCLGYEKWALFDQNKVLNQES